MLAIRTDMAMSATLAGFAKRYSAKYVQTGRSVVNEFRRPSPSLDRADGDGVDPALRTIILEQCALCSIGMPRLGFDDLRFSVHARAKPAPLLYRICSERNRTAVYVYADVLRCVEFTERLC